MTRYFNWPLFIRPTFNIFLVFYIFSWLLGSISGISFIKGISRSTNFKTEMWQILVIFMLSGRSSLYITGPRTLYILKNSNLVKFNLLLGFVVWINVIFVFSILCRRYTVTCAGQAFQIWCVALFLATRWRCLSFLSLYTAIEFLSIGYTLCQ